MELELNDQLTRNNSIMESIKPIDKTRLNMNYLNKTKHMCYFKGRVLKYSNSFVGVSLCDNMVCLI